MKVFFWLIQEWIVPEEGFTSALSGPLGTLQEALAFFATFRVSASIIRYLFG